MQQPRQCPPASVTDTVVDTVFAWIPRQLEGEPEALGEFRQAQARAALARLRLPDTLTHDLRSWSPSVMPFGSVDAFRSAAVLVWFQVHPDGRLAGMRLEQRAASSALNVEMQRAILRADSTRSLLPLPRSHPREPVDLWLAAGYHRLEGAENIPIGRHTYVRQRFAGPYTPPRLVNRGRPLRFPDAAVDLGVGDELLMEFVIDTAGRAIPSSIVPVRASFREFAADARSTILTMRFEPARANGCPIEQRVIMPVNYRVR